LDAPAASASASQAPAPGDFEVQSAVIPENVVADQVAAEKEIDLSAEWEGSIAEEPTETSPAQEHGAEVAATGQEENPSDPEAIKETVEEVRFYLSNGMHEEAYAAFAKLEGLKPEPSLLSALGEEIEAAVAKSPTPEAESVEEISVDDIPSVPEEEAASVPEPKVGALDAFVSDLESSLGEEFLPQTTAHEVAPAPEPEPTAAEYAVASTEPKPGGKLGTFVSDLEASLGDSFLAGAPVAQAETPSEAKVVRETEAEPVSLKSDATVASSAAPQALAAMAAAAAQSGLAPGQASVTPTFTYSPSTVRPVPARVPGQTPAKFDSGPDVDLADMFGELKHELEDGATVQDEDPETHYNLGVAFREMGLLDEAIGELQKVCQAVDRGHPFPHVMQTYTWLSQCFLDKGIPEAAIRWYERALQLSTIDADTRTALHYELASSYETAGDKTLALHHFMQVYGSNIDYRDVGERIKTLKS
jgi:tetratricopeptide (TPR) repeat protein